MVQLLFRSALCCFVLVYMQATAQVTPADNRIAQFQYNFNSCSIGGVPGSGFTTFSASGDSVWRCTSFGFNNSNGVQINGFSTATGGGVLNEDWLLSPRMDLTTFTVPLLRFYSRSRFSGMPLRLLVSTNYSGSGDPNLATWTEIFGFFPELNSDRWKLSDSINLTAFRSAQTTVAWVYQSNPTEGASRWTVDEILLYNNSLPPQPQVVLPVEQARLLLFPISLAGTSSAAQQFRFWPLNHNGTLTLTAPAGFELSRNNTNFSSSISFTAAENNGAISSAFVRFSPTQNDQAFGGSIRFSGNNLLTNRLDLSASSMPRSKTLDVVTWNLEWFGSLSNGPLNDDLQLQHAITAMDSLDADLYLLQEIVDTARLGFLSRNLRNGPYDYVVSPLASAASSPAAPAWLTAQKLAFVYRRTLFTGVQTRAFTSTSTFPDHNFNWSSGRFPFLLDAFTTVDGITKRIMFINIHAKAEGGVTGDFIRRQRGALVLHDTLQGLFSTRHFIVAGDYNDDLDETISTTAGTDQSPYQIFLDNPASFTAISLWNSLRGDFSFIGFPNVIDHAILSNEMAGDYHAFSCVLRQDATTWVPDYANTLTDHLPLYSRFNLRQSGTNVVTSTRMVSRSRQWAQVLGNPGPQPVLRFSGATSQATQLQLMDVQGRMLWQQQYQRVPAGYTQVLPLEHLPPGIYSLVIVSGQERQLLRLVR